MQVPKKSPEPRYSTKDASWTMFCNETNFWKHLRDDMDLCSKSIKIVSPFLRLETVRDLSDRLKKLRQNNVQIIVYARQPDDDEGKESLAFLIDLGVQVEIRRKFHHKIVIIDDRIWWEGSLNVLSYWDSSDHMRRFEGPEAQNLLHKLGLD